MAANGKDQNNYGNDYHQQDKNASNGKGKNNVGQTYDDNDSAQGSPEQPATFL